MQTQAQQPQNHAAKKKKKPNIAQLNRLEGLDYNKLNMNTVIFERIRRDMRAVWKITRVHYRMREREKVSVVLFENSVQTHHAKI